MYFRVTATFAMAVLCVSAAGMGMVRPDDLGTRPPRQAAATPQQARQVVERGLAFLEKDAAKWRAERKCASCHHGTMTVWALAEAKSRGYPVAAETIRAEIDQFMARQNKDGGWGQLRELPSDAYATGHASAPASDEALTAKPVGGIYNVHGVGACHRR